MIQNLDSTRPGAPQSLHGSQCGSGRGFDGTRAELKALTVNWGIAVLGYLQPYISPEIKATV